MTRTLRRRSVLWLFALSGGLWLWAAQFGVVYVLAALVCARGIEGPSLGGLGFVPLATALVTLVAMAGCSLLLAWSLRTGRRETDAGEADRFVLVLTALVSALSILAVVWTGLPALIVPVCEPGPASGLWAG